jgi:hypothetical protein
LNQANNYTLLTAEHADYAEKDLNLCFEAGQQLHPLTAEHADYAEKSFEFVF